MKSAPVPAVETVIVPSRGMRLAPWAELHAYRDLLWLMVWKDISARYKQTVLGAAWYVVQPLLTTVVFSVVFGRMARMSTSGVPPALFYLSGLVVWNYFAATFTSTATSLSYNSGIFGKVYFPRLIIPLSGIFSNLVTLVIQVLTFAGFYFAYKFTPQAASFGITGAIWLLPLIVLQVAALSLGMGLALAALSIRFRDFALLSTFLLQLWMYATPIIYPLAQIPVRWRLVMDLNPMSMPVESIRLLLLGTGSVTPGLVALSAGMTVFVLLIGLLVFSRVEKTFVDII